MNFCWCVSDCQGCFNKVPQVVDHKKMTEISFSQFLRPEVRPNRAGEGFSPRSQTLHPYMVEAAGKLCGVSFLTALIPLMKAPSHLITSQSSHLLTPPPLGVKIPTHEFWGDTHSVQNPAQPNHTFLQYPNIFCTFLVALMSQMAKSDRDCGSL